MLPAMSGLSREQRLLQCFRVPTTDNVYILGCFERRVTIHSQQIRAFNLIHSLYATSYQPHQAPHFVIIGAGIAGLTAAYAALKKRARVTLIEQHPQPLALLRGCLTRWIHPNIYDWPEPSSTDPITKLPAFNWRADYAGEVAKVLLKDWEELVIPPYREHLTTHYSASTIQPDIKNKRVSFTIFNDQKQVKTERINYDVLILAVGFGVEKSIENHTVLSYWRNDDLAQTPPKFTAHRPAEILISGVGDGGLTDIMRLRLTDFEHQDFLTEFIEDGDLSEIASILLRLERDIYSMDAQRASEFIYEEYKKLSIPASAIKKIQGRLRIENKVTLNGTMSSVFQKDSSVLNRFITFILLQSGDLRYYQGKIKSIKPVRKHKYRVTFVNQGSEDFDRVIIRHGTDSSIENIKEIFSLCSPLKTMAALDETRTPLWSEDSFDDVPTLARSVQAINTSPKFDAWIKLLDKQAANPLLKRLRSLIPDSTIREQFEKSSLATVPFDVIDGDTISPWDHAQWAYSVIEGLGMIVDAQRITSLLNVAECLILTALPFIIQKIRKTEMHYDLKDAAIFEVFKDYLTEIPELYAEHNIINEADLEMAEIFRSWIRFRFAQRLRGLATQERVESIVNSGTEQRPTIWTELGWETVSLLCRAIFLSERDVVTLRESSASITGVKYSVRLPLVFALLYLAENSILVPGNLSIALLFHLKALGAAAFQAIREQISSARVRYDVPNKCMIVEAKCSEPYVDHALTEYTEELNKKLNNISPKIANLLPIYFHMPQLAYAKISAQIIDKKEAYIKPLIRFSMDTASIQKLLMGNQLWKDATLAIRELYQNALDACRYRRCRATFKAVQYEARVLFIEGTDSKGRRFIECIDNGIGMDIDMLQHNFAKAGRRFVNTADYLREREAWRQNGINLSPVSRFGIGVFSYYLIADEIEIETCRLARDGLGLGDRIYVSIPTSDSLFRVSPVPADTCNHTMEDQALIDDWRRGAGTRVRLYLRHAIALPMETHRHKSDSFLLSSLKRFVGLPETELFIINQGKAPVSWLPGILNLDSETNIALSKNCWALLKHIPELEDSEQSELRSYRGRGIPEDYDPYKNFRNPFKGWLLIDGITTSHRLPCLTINLTGDERPKLAVDRVEVEDVKSYELSSTLTKIISNCLADWNVIETPITARWLTGLWLGFPRELTQLWRHFEKISQKWSYSAPTIYFDDWTGSADERKYFPLDEVELRRFCLGKSTTNHADQLLQVCRAVYWNRTRPVREKRERDSEMSQHYDGDWIEKLRFDYIDGRVLDFWRNYHAGPIEAALLHYYKYGQLFNGNSSAVFYASWLTGQPIGVCVTHALQLSNLLEFEAPIFWEKLKGNTHIIEDRDAWMLSHCGVNAAPHWIEEEFSVHSVLIISRNRRESLKKIAAELKALSDKTAMPIRRIELDKIELWEEFVDDDLLQQLPYGADIADNGQDFLFTCSFMSGGFKALIDGIISPAQVLKYVKALGFTPPEWDIEQFKTLSSLSSADKILLGKANNRVFPLRFSDGSLLDIATAHYLLEQPVKDCIRRANELRERLRLPTINVNEDSARAIEELTPDDYKLLSERWDRKAPFRSGPFAVIDLLRCWIGFGNDVLAHGRRLMHISSVLGWDPPAWDLASWNRLPRNAEDREIFSARYDYLTGFSEFEIPTIGRLILLAAKLGKPLWYFEERIKKLQALSGIAPIEKESVYCGVSWSDLVDESKKLAATV